MSSRTFLSLPLKSWTFSLGIHLFIFMLLVMIIRNHSAPLGAVELEFAALSNDRGRTSDQADEEWQNPRRVVPQKPLKREKPALSIPLSGLEVSGAGAGGSELSAKTSISRPPRYKTQVKAQYTQAARNAHIEGEVILQVDIDASGAVKKVELIKGLGYGLDEAAINAMRQSTFFPAYAGEIPVPVSLPQPYKFKFEY